MEVSFIFAISIIILTYVGLALGYLSFFQMNRAGLTMVSVSFLLLLGILDFQEAWKALDNNTLVFLFGIMILNTHLGYAGFFGFVLKSTLTYVKSPLLLLIVITFSSGLLSALFLNDTMALMLTPLIYGITRSLKLNPKQGIPVLSRIPIIITRSLKLNPKPYLLFLMLAVNTGSLMTPTGNPQNMIIKI